MYEGDIHSNSFVVSGAIRSMVVLVVQIAPMGMIGKRAGEFEKIVVPLSY